MAYDNFWRIDADSHDALKCTENIYKIMNEQCDYLFKDTQGRVFAIFGEIKVDGSLIAMARAMSSMVKGVSGLTGLKETVAEVSTKELIDANSMYFDKSYGFEVCTEKYRFRLFELRMKPVYPIEIIVDEGICTNIGNALSRIAVPTEKSNSFKIFDEAVFVMYYKRFCKTKRYDILLTNYKEGCQRKWKKRKFYRTKSFCVKVEQMKLFYKLLLKN